MNSAFGAPMRGHAIPLTLLTVAATVMLTACGGGSGGGTPAAPSASTPVATTSKPGTSTTPSTLPERTLKPGAEIPPNLSDPQEGSTARTGNDTQGIYEDGRHKLELCDANIGVLERYLRPTPPATPGIPASWTRSRNTTLSAVMFSVASFYPEEGAYRFLVFHVGSNNGFLTSSAQKR